MVHCGPRRPGYQVADLGDGLIAVLAAASLAEFTSARAAAREWLTWDGSRTRPGSLDVGRSERCCVRGDGDAPSRSAIESDVHRRTGNAGSAADAQHFATEIVCRVRRDRRALRAIALTTDSSALTAIGNDHGFERIFGRQIEALADPATW